jgi:glycosyltransferase involved in cell wall biosynthesis
MDLVADQLLAYLPVAAPAVAAIDLAPPFRRAVQRLPGVGRRHVAFNADRLFNRHLTLPRFVRRVAGRFDLVHVADHTYAHVAAAVPPGRCGVYCHDLDAFRCLLEPGREPRPSWFRALARRTLNGLQRAAVVFHSTDAVRDQLTRNGLVDPARLVHAPYGVAAEFVSDPGRPVELPVPVGGPYLLHIGSNIPRKRIDVLLDVFAAVRAAVPGLRLVQVGGPWPGVDAARIDRLGIGAALAQIRGLTRDQLAELYRRAAAVLVPSEAEGFGLPVIEALACGSPVVASDLPVLREVGGPATVFRPVGDVAGWADAVRRLLAGESIAPPRSDRVAWAARYSWKVHAETIAAAYCRLRDGRPDNLPT